MSTFEKLNLSKPLYNAIADLGFEQPTPIQSEAVPLILSGRDVVGIAQTGTGKTFAYLWPILRDLKYSNQVNPRVLIVVPTRELVVQVVEQAESLTKYSNTRVLGVYGGTNINAQKEAVVAGTDILVATAGRLYDLIQHDALRLNAVKKLVIDEVDEMLDLGFRFQLERIFDILPRKRQNIMFSATMTEEVDVLIDDYFNAPARISIALSGTPLGNIAQQCYQVKNFYTKVNLLAHLLSDRKEFSKVLVFVSSKRGADRLFEALEELYGSELCVIHSNKSQNYRLRSIEKFEQGKNRILLTTDVMARGLDLDKISHVINFDTPAYPENYMHRIGRTGRAEEKGKTILFHTWKEESAKRAIEKLMDYSIPVVEFPEEVDVSEELTPEERPKNEEIKLKTHKVIEDSGGAFHEKKLKNTKTNQGGSYLRKMKKYKKPLTKGDKNFNQRSKKR
ncbi:MAG: DEAD/DEAH box helicase [Bacteroidia bacterium]|nr:MAG: DEAD/DEAH box helicase [Bacteroidia bacterium]